jgi:hypothetical protein
VIESRQGIINVPKCSVFVSITTGRMKTAANGVVVDVVVE